MAPHDSQFRGNKGRLNLVHLKDSSKWGKAGPSEYAAPEFSGSKFLLAIAAAEAESGLDLWGCASTRLLSTRGVRSE